MVGAFGASVKTNRKRLEMTNLRITKEVPSGETREYNLSGGRIIPLTKRIGGILIAESNYEIEHAQPEEPALLRIHCLVSSSAPGGIRNEDWATRLELYGAVDPQLLIDTPILDNKSTRPLLADRTVWDKRKFEPNTRNKIGGLGAYRNMPDSDGVSSATAQLVSMI
jgi:hypothetical protein